jgi:hypothetical protein
MLMESRTKSMSIRKNQESAFLVSFGYYTYNLQGAYIIYLNIRSTCVSSLGGINMKFAFVVNKKLLMLTDV